MGNGSPEGVAPGGAGQAGTIREIAERAGVPNLIARILVARGVRTPGEAEVFLRPRLADLSDPFLLPDMDKGVARLVEAVGRGERICIWGDYDADGVSCLALMVNFLTHLGVAPVIHIPTREEGYGLHIDKVEDLAKQDVSLIVSLDCGASNGAEIAHAKSLGVDTIVVDHHEMGPEVPPAVAVINPKRRDSRFPTRDLAACGVTFFFLLGMRRVMHGKGLMPAHINLKKELDLVTVGTVGDMVPLTGDNRILVRHGMEVMNAKPRAWLRSMLDTRVISKGLINEFALGFIIVPRINAAGRVASPHPALDFLVARETGSALNLLAHLQKLNSLRQQREKKIHEEIVNAIGREGLSGRKTIVVFNEAWHAGVLGIVAQKLTEQFERPAIVITRVNGVWKGSGRGGEGMDLFEAIRSVSPYLLKYGGHKYACGISLEEQNLTLFAEAFERAVKGGISPRKRALHVDTEATFDELTAEAMERLEDLGPFGIGNPRPNLAFEATGISVTPKGYTRVTDAENRTWDGFYVTKVPLKREGAARIIASPVVKRKMGERFIHLNIKKVE